MKEDIKSMTLPELTTWMSALGEKGFRAKQLYNWMHKNLVSSFDEMTNLSAALREDLSKRYYINQLSVIKKLVSKLDGTQKYLLRLKDNNCVEACLLYTSPSPRDCS